MVRRKQRKSAPPPSTIIPKVGNNWPKQVFAFLAGSGILAVLIGVIYQYIAGYVSLEYVQEVGRAYEFQFRNDTPADRTVKLFRIDPPVPQEFVYKVTEDVRATVDDQGSIELPGGNLIYVPAAEFKELDGQRVPANSSLKFRVPPLSSRSWLEPEATIVDVRYQLESSNYLLARIEALLDIIGVRPRIRKRLPSTVLTMLL